MISRMVHLFSPHFLGIFPSRETICIFSGPLLGFPFITQLFAFNFNPNENYLLTCNRQGPRKRFAFFFIGSEALLKKAFKFKQREKRQRHDVEKISFTKK